MKWTHKVVHKPTGRWWMAVLNGGVLTCSEYCTKLAGRTFYTAKSSVEAIYHYDGYTVEKLKEFKGNL